MRSQHTPASSSTPAVAPVTCTINPGFDPADRYWTVTAPTSGAMRLASCAASGGRFLCIGTHVAPAGIDDDIQVLIY